MHPKRSTQCADRMMELAVTAMTTLLTMLGRHDFGIGFGRLGQAIEGPKKFGAKFRPLNELHRESDFVVLAVPLAKETYHMINEEKLKLMKPTAILINIAGKVDTKPQLGR